MNNKSNNLILSGSSIFKVSVISMAMLSSAAIAKQNYSLRHIEKNIVVDGVMDEPQWQNATKIELNYEVNPGEGIKASAKTLGYLYEDGENLNIAIVATDPDPSKIRAHLSDRDSLWSDDFAGIVIDTFNDQRTAYEFFVNPKGVQGDLRMEDSNGWREDMAWDAIWDSAGKINETGYIVELSIPLKALRFPDQEGELTWNIALMRTYPRDNRYQFANYKSDRSIKCNICLFDSTTGLADVKPGRNLQLTPTMTAGRSDEREDDPTGPWNEGDSESDVGVDVRWGVTQDMVINATLNPDFSQVEADAGQLDVNNTFSLFFPEKRPFFLDGADYFNTARYNLVHTRNIASPDYGVKLTGKTNSHSYAVMAANDEKTTFLLPGNEGSDIASLDIKSDVAIGRYKKDVGERSNVGVLLTNRQGTNYKNSVASVDGSYWANDEDNFSYQLAWSDSNNPLQLTDSNAIDSEVDEDSELAPTQQGRAISLGYSHNTRDYTIRAGYNDISEDFRADVGFMGRANFRKIVFGGSQRWYGEKGDTLNEWGYFGDIDRTEDQDGKMIEQEAEIHLNLQGKNQFFSNMGIVHRERLYDGLYFDETQGMAYAEITPVANLRLNSFIRFGRQIDFSNTQLGNVLGLEAGATWDATEHLNIKANYNFNKLTVDGDTLFTADLTDVRFSYQFDLKSYLRLVVQYRTVDREVELYNDPSDYDAKYRGFSTQLLYSYKLNPQSLVFLGYSDNGFQDDELESLERTGRTVFAKFSYAFQI